MKWCRPSVCLSVCPSVCLSVRLRQQFGWALAFKFIAEWPLTIPLINFTCRYTLMSSTHCDLCLWPWHWKFKVLRSNLLLRLNSWQNDHWQYLFQTSHVDRPWWVLPILNFVCDLDFEGSKFQGQMCNWHSTSLFLHHGQLLFHTSDVDRPWWVLSIVTFVCCLDLECSKFQGQMCNWPLFIFFLLNIFFFNFFLFFLN